MAKRVPPGEKVWNPVEDKLAQEALQPEAVMPAQAAAPAPSTLRVVTNNGHREPSPTEPKSEAKGGEKEETKEAEKLCREKRVLLTESEEDTLERLVKDMGRRLGTPLKLSHVLRATTSLLLHSQEELLKQSEKVGRLKRPANNDPAGLATFEHNLARILDRAIRGSRVMD
jgi:hypothetical protein